MEKDRKDILKDKVRGCMLGGAAGDALGYPVEFCSEREIFSRFGPEGITSYQLSNGKALISDDTQMALFTANGILLGDTRHSFRGIGGIPHNHVPACYKDWYRTQTRSYEEVHLGDMPSGRGGYSWLLDVPELYARRAPGNTCLSALSALTETDDYIAAHVNTSKGCGGIMRTAPLAMRYASTDSLLGLDEEAAQLAAITHGHSLGYMPSAVLNHILCRILVNDGNPTLEEIVTEARDAARELFAGDRHLAELTEIIDLAIRLSKNQEPDLYNIHKIGEGWVAEETLGIAVYCALKYQHDFSRALAVSVSHNGDSDSTGAVTGNIVGAITGYDAIDKKWKENLELKDVILEMADDLYTGCPMNEYSEYVDPLWVEKYMKLRRPKEEKP